MFKLKPLHVGISVPDMDESLRWYEEILGFRLVSRMYSPEIKSDKAFMEKDGFFIELFQYDSPLELPGNRIHPNTDLQQIGTKHICFHTENMDGLVQMFQSKAVDIVFYEVIDHIPTCFIRDNSNILLEFMEWNG